MLAGVAATAGPSLRGVETSWIASRTLRAGCTPMVLSQGGSACGGARRDDRCAGGARDRVLVRIRQQLQLPQRHADRGGSTTARRSDRVEAVPAGAHLPRTRHGKLALRLAK